MLPRRGVVDAGGWMLDAGKLRCEEGLLVYGWAAVVASTALSYPTADCRLPTDELPAFSFMVGRPLRVI